MPLQPQTGWYKSGHGIFGILLLFMQSLPKLGLGVSGAAVLLCSPCGGTGVAGIFTFWLLGWLLFSLLLVVVCLVSWQDANAHTNRVKDRKETKKLNRNIKNIFGVIKKAKPTNTNCCT